MDGLVILLVILPTEVVVVGADVVVIVIVVLFVEFDDLFTKALDVCAFVVDIGVDVVVLIR